MVRARKTPGLEAGAAYGEVGENLAAMNAIPIAGEEPAGGVVTPQQANVPAVQAPAPPGPLPLEAATGYTPQVTPLTAPGRGITRGISRPAPTPNQDAAVMLQNWAEAVNDPALVEAAIQLSQ